MSTSLLFVYFNLVLTFDNLSCISFCQSITDFSLFSLAILISIPTFLCYLILPITSPHQFLSLLSRHFDSLMYCHSSLCFSACHDSKSRSILRRRVLLVKNTYTCSVFGMSLHYNFLVVDMSTAYPSQSWHAPAQHGCHVCTCWNEIEDRSVSLSLKTQLQDWHLLWTCQIIHCFFPFTRTSYYLQIFSGLIESMYPVFLIYPNFPFIGFCRFTELCS